ncbi:MAG: transcriptional repressor [Phycisphaeraceae bacterium]|nr:transcriptional repressor [Phycisphaeraceae bacterium]MCW5755045.1 transcriptional repressor [Phycisphaeraceae bacterium]
MNPEEARALFRSRDLRCTKQREEIYVALAASKSHPTAEELFTQVRSAEPGLSLATVYNTLETLEQCGLVRKLPSVDGKGPCRFDADVSAHVHLALPDGRILDLPRELAEPFLSALGETLRQRVEALTGEVVHRLSLHLTAHAETPPKGDFCASDDDAPASS